MKKIFTKIGIVLVLVSSGSPLVACSFNFYINRAANAIARSFANQTSSVLKSLVMSKTLDSDTGSTNDDIMSQNKNGSIANLASGQNLNSWGEFANKWGTNSMIDVNGFDPNTYFKATGTGTLTKNINARRSINKGFTTASQIRLLTAITNPNLYTLAINPTGIAHEPIVAFLKTLQGDLKNKPALLQLIINLVNNYNNEFIPAISQLMGNLVNGDWDISGQKTPSDLEQLKNFMINWKDTSSIQPYSAWVNGTNWDLNDAKTTALIVVTKGHNLDLWSQDDFNLYRGGSLINYLFWKISNDHHEIVNPVPLTPPHTAPRYLGDVLSDHIVNNNIDIDGLLKDISQFLPFLLTNPTYLLLIIEGVIPIIKKWILAMPDITFGVKHLTVGDIATSQTNKSFNLLDIANNIKTLVNDHSKLEAVIKKIIGWSDNDKTLDTFTYDIKLNINSPIGKINIPLGSVLNSSFISEDTKNSLVTSVVGFLTSSKGKNIVNVIIDFISQLNNQYPTGQHVDINLLQTQIFLLNTTNGLLTKLTTVMLTLKDIIKNTSVQDSDIEQLYLDLGGNKPTSPNYDIFSVNFPISILQKAMTYQNSELSKILNLLFGTTTDDGTKKLGILNIVTDFNNKWIKANYEDYFDITNTKLGYTYNIVIKYNTVDNIQNINLKYNFNYTISTTTYHFVVTATDSENLSTFQGIHNFKFKTITLINL